MRKAAVVVPSWQLVEQVYELETAGTIDANVAARFLWWSTSRECTLVSDALGFEIRWRTASGEKTARGATLGAALDLADDLARGRGEPR